MKLTTETKRFLNHIEREKNLIVSAAKYDSTALKNEILNEKKLRYTAESERNAMSIRIAQLENELQKLRPQYSALIIAAKSLLPKLRININTSDHITPRWFKTGKWWSRETGGLESDFVAEMTDDEIIEATEFYAKTESQLMLPKSNRMIAEEVKS